MASANADLNQNASLGPAGKDSSNVEPKEETFTQYFKNLRNEFTYDKLWGKRTWEEIGTHFCVTLLFGLLPSVNDTVTDSLLCHDFWYGKNYLKTVPSTTDPSVNMSGCNLIGFYTEVNNGTQHVISYDYGCFQADPIYAIHTLGFILIPSMFTWQVLPKTKSFVTNIVMLVIAILSSCLITFPVLLLSVKTVGLINPGEKWQTLAFGLTQCEGFFESSPQVAVQLFIIFTRADRQPSFLQVMTISASLLLLTKTSITSLLQPRGNQQQLSTKEKAVNALTLLPMVLSNYIFKLVTIALVFSMLRSATRLVILLAIVYLLLIVSEISRLRVDDVSCSVNIKNWFKFDSRDSSLWQNVFQNPFGLSCLPASYTEIQQKKQLKFHNTFWFIINTLVLGSLLLVANLAPETTLHGYNLTMADLPIVQDIHLLNTIVPVVWSCGVVSNVLIHFQA